MKLNALKTILGCLILLCSFGIVKNALAENQPDFSGCSYTNYAPGAGHPADSDYYIVQQFTAHHNNISRITSGMIPVNWPYASSSFMYDFYLCAGTIASSSFSNNFLSANWENEFCNEGDNPFNEQTTWNILNIATTSNQAIWYEATTSIEAVPKMIASGTDYYVIIKFTSDDNPDDGFVFDYQTSNCNPKQSNVSSANQYDWVFYTYYDDEYIGLTSWEENYDVEIVEIWPPTCDDEPCARLKNNPKYCFFDLTTDCTLDFSYNDLFSPAIAYAVPTGQLPGGTDPWVYLFDDNGGYESIVLNNPGVATTSYYSLYADITGYGGYRLSTYEVEWASSTDISTSSALIDKAMCNCDDVATSSFEWWAPDSYAGSMRYALECSGHMLGCWLFTPSPTTQAEFSALPEKFFTITPVSEMYDIVQLSIDMGNATVSTPTFPILWASSTDNQATITDLNLLAINNIDTEPGYAVLGQIRQVFIYLLYLLTFFYLMYRLVSIRQSD